MQTFKQFLGEGRTEDISTHSAQSWMSQHAMNYLKSGKFLFRGMSERNEPHGSILTANTNDGAPRKSVGGMANYYTLWMTHNPKWNGKPRRERSFISSTEAGDAASWGKLYLVVPSNGAQIGAVGANDIWNKRVNEYLSFAEFTNITRDILKHADKSVRTYEDLEDALKSVSYEQLVEIQRSKSWWVVPKPFTILMEEKKAANLFELWEHVFSPNKFQFSTPSDIKGAGELWVDGEAMFIPLKHDLGPETSDMIDWAEDYAPKLAALLKKYWKYDNDGGEHVDPDTVSARDTLTYQKKKTR